MMDAAHQEQSAVALRYHKRRMDVRRRLDVNRAADRKATKAAAASRKAAGISPVSRDSDDADWRRFDGPDTRSLTGQLLGDPIPNDWRRREWCPWLMERDNG